MPKYDYVGEFGVNNQLFFCGVPFRLDSYSGCSHQCRYCFARAAELTNSATKNRTSSILIPDPKHFKHCLFIALETTDSRDDINIEWLRHRVPIHWGGMSDPFQPCEEYYKISKNWMEMINWHQYPVAISTKGTTILTSPDYLKLLKEGKYAVQITLIGDDEELLGRLEPGAPSASERMLAISKLSEAGIWTAVRIQPVIPGTSLEKNLPDFIYKLSKLGVKHVLAEGYKVPTRSEEWMKEVWQLFPEALLEYQAYCKDYFGFEKLLPSWRKWQYIKPIIQACHENGMTFGAADNDLRDLGDTICCCGLDNIPSFEGFWRYQASQAVQVAKEKGFVTIEDMEQYWSGGSESMDSGNVLNQEMYQEIYGYPKGKAGERNKSIPLHQHIQKGEMRKEARSEGTRYTAKWCVDWMWNNGGECSPETMASMTKESLNGQITYRYNDPIPKLEAQQVKQPAMF